MSEGERWRVWRDHATFPCPCRYLHMRTHPVAYLITFRTYGTWLHGDPRGSVHRRACTYGTPLYPPMPGLVGAERAELKHAPIRLNAIQRGIVARTVGEVCSHRAWTLYALAVRVEHVHVVLSLGLDIRPEEAMTSLKAWASRRMIEAGALPNGARAWARHGSTRYLWSQDRLHLACSYVLDGQGERLFEA